MQISYSKYSIKYSIKLTPTLNKKIQERITIFSENPLHHILRNHPLKGKYKDYCSIDIICDMRALYLQKETEIIFDIIDTHGQLL